MTFATRNEWYFERITGNLTKCDGQPEKPDESVIFEIQQFLVSNVALKKSGFYFDK